MNLAQSQRAALATLLAATGPDAQTIIGWTTHDLLAHLWVRDNDPLAIPGMGFHGLAALTESRMSRAKKRFPYAEMVRRFRHPPRWTALMTPANGVEFLVHRLDVLRADPALDYLHLTRAEQDILWSKVKLLAIRLRRVGMGIVLERTDSGAEIRAASGNRIVTIAGPPSEIVMVLTGRLKHARVELIGPAPEIERLTALDLSL